MGQVMMFADSNRRRLISFLRTAWNYTGSKQKLPQKSEFRPRRSAIGNVESFPIRQDDEENP